MALDLSVAGLVLLAAVFHASWNAIAKSSGDFLLTFSLLSGVAGVAGAVLAVASPMPAPESWPYIAAASRLKVFAMLPAINVMHNTLECYFRKSRFL